MRTAERILFLEHGTPPCGLQFTRKPITCVCYAYEQPKSQLGAPIDLICFPRPPISDELKILLSFLSCSARFYFCVTFGISKPSLSTAKPPSCALTEGCSTRTTRPWATNFKDLPAARNDENNISILTTAPAGGQLGVKINAPDLLTSRVTPSPCTRSLLEPRQVNTTGAVKRYRIALLSSTWRYTLFSVSVTGHRFFNRRVRYSQFAGLPRCRRSLTWSLSVPIVSSLLYLLLVTGVVHASDNYTHRLLQEGLFSTTLSLLLSHVC